MLYTDDVYLLPRTKKDLQTIMDHFSRAYTVFGLTTSIKRTKVTYAFPKPNISGSQGRVC